MKKQKIRLILRSYDYEKLDKSVKDIIRTVLKTGSQIIGPVPLPNITKYFTVLRSPNNDKKARDQFEITTHKRLLDVEITPNATRGVEETMDALMKLHISSAIDVEIK